MNVRSILAIKGKDVATIKPDQTIEASIAKMDRHNIGALVVVDEAGQMVGIITERHIIRQMVQRGNILAEPVSTVMKTDVITGVPQDDLHHLAETMTEKRVRHLPILSEGKLVGIVSIGDVLKAQRDSYKGAIDTLETQMLADKK